MNSVHVGTSGWYYKDWHASFYPPHLKKAELLSYYASQFPTVEINASFYRLLTAKAVADWKRKVPSGFVFAVKGSRFITHMKRLLDPKEALKKFFTSIEGFGPSLGPLLWQLPGNLKKDVSRLEEFLQCLPGKYCHAVEFRDPSWMDDEVFSVLRRRKASLVWLSSKAMPREFICTGDFVYIRFHGLAGGAAHDYTREELRPWARKIKEAAEDGKKVYAYFNNDVNTRAPLNARMLMDMTRPFAFPPVKAKKEVKGEKVAA
jgi:uncharacterized protein YecE (DUF72 family)